MNTQSIQPGQVDFQDTTADRTGTDGFSLLPGFIGFYQDAQRIKPEAGQLYAMNDAELYDAGMSSREEMPTQLAKMYR